MITKLEIADKSIVVVHHAKEYQIFADYGTDITELLNDGAKKLIYNALVEEEIYIKELNV